MAKRSKKTDPPEAAKPYDDFPLFVHATNRWAKKVRGKLHYFGKASDDAKGEKALDLWLVQKDDLLAGRKPRIERDGLTVALLADKFLNAKLRMLESGELSPRTFNDYHATCGRLVDQFGKTRLVDDLAADDFDDLRATLAKSRGVVALGNEISRVRVVLKYAYDAGLVNAPIRTGPGFKRPSKKTLRLDKAEKGQKLFAADEVRSLLASATPIWRAMILLGCNAALGNSDIGSLRMRHLDLDNGWLDYPRPKTGIHRKVPLWKETTEALREAIAQRPRPKDEADTDLVFITKYGESWSKSTSANPISAEFRKLLEDACLHGVKGRNFYSLRHTFATVASGSKDQLAVDAIMGHADPHMRSAYIERIDDDRLRAVVNHVHSWLWPAKNEFKVKRRKSRTRSKPTRKRATPSPASDDRPQLRVVG